MPYSAGGALDLSMRALAEILSDQIGVPVNVLNRAGGGSVVGTTELSMCKPDGLSIGVLVNNAFSVQPFINNVEFSIDDFDPIIGVCDEPGMMWVAADSPFNTVQDMIDYYKDHPEETLLFANSGVGGVNYITQMAVMNLAGLTNYEPIACNNGTECMTSLIGGHVQMANGSSIEGNSFFASGEIKPLCVFNTKSHELEQYKDVPTIVESGYDIGLSAWQFMAMPAGAPDEIVNFWNEQFATAFEDARYIEFCQNVNKVIPEKPLTGDEIVDRLVKEIEVSEVLLKQIGMTK